MTVAWREGELLIATVARLLAGVRHVAVGAASPIPAAGALLARELAGGNLTVSLLGSEEHNSFSDGGTELFDCAAQGRIDAFFLSGVQIDGRGNVNLLGLGPRERVTKRFSGCFGSTYLAFLVPRLILFREEHNPKTLVEQVDFVSAPGTSGPGTYRPGGPKALLTGRCLFRFRNGGFELESIHPGHTLDEVSRETGFRFAPPSEVRETMPPDADVLEAIRGPVYEALRSAYPRFIDRILALKP